MRKLGYYFIAAMVLFALGSKQLHAQTTEQEELPDLRAGIVNLALLPDVEVTTSYVSSWESLAAVNDGHEPKHSEDRSNSIYGNWVGDDGYGVFNWVQYEWPAIHHLSGMAVYWFTDNGGLLPPDEAYAEYWNGDEWVRIKGKLGLELNKFNTMRFDLKTNKIRLSMKSATSTGIIEWQVTGVETICDTPQLTPFITLNEGTQKQEKHVTARQGDKITFRAELDVDDGKGRWSWVGPNGVFEAEGEYSFTASDATYGGVYTATYQNECGRKAKTSFVVTYLDGEDGAYYQWPEYSPTLNYHFRQEYPDIEMPTKDLIDDTNIAGTISEGWWTFHWGPNANKKITEAAVRPMLKRMNEDFEYIRDVMGWPPDKRAKSGYRSAIYLYGSGLNTDDANNETDLGGWQGAIYFEGQSWPMVLLSWYPVYAYDPDCGLSDRDYQMGAVVHEGIHSVLADMPGCKNAAWFHEGGNTWLQQEMDSERSGDYSEMGFLNAASIIAPFMPIECYSGWLQDESFGGPSAEGVNKFNGSQQICTWKKTLGGTQYSNAFPVFLGLTLGNGSVPWIWRYCENRVLEGMAAELGDKQMRRLLMEYRAKQALVDMGKWTDAFIKLLDGNFKSAIGPEWEPYWLPSPTWTATPYAKTTIDANRVLTPEYRTTPGWSGGNIIPLHARGEVASVNFQPIGDNMTCQLCYRTEEGEAIYGQAVYQGDCMIKLDKKPANGVIFAVITNTDYIYEGEETRKAHYDYRLQLGEGIHNPADIYQKWYNWTLKISDPASMEEISEMSDSLVKIYQSPAQANANVYVEFMQPIEGASLLTVMDMTGKQLYQQRLSESLTTIPAGRLNKGVNLFRVTTATKTITHKLFVQ